MGAIKDPTHLLDVERQAYHASRPGFRIAELTITPTQKVPWHCHSNVQDTFYVLEGHLRIFCATPRRRCASRRAKPIRFAHDARTLLPTAVTPRRLFWFCKVSANTISSRSPSRKRASSPDRGFSTPQGCARPAFPLKLNQYREFSMGLNHIIGKARAERWKLRYEYRQIPSPAPSFLTFERYQNASRCRQKTSQ